MDRELLLLGLLRQKDMHAYRINEVLSAQVDRPITIKKATAYDLLRQMEKMGWTVSRYEQVGNRPVRRVYSITPDGEAAFQRLLRERLANYARPEFPGAVSLSFVRWLPRTVARALLEQRRGEVEAVVETIKEMIDRRTEEADDDLSDIQTRYVQRFYKSELEWLDEILVQFSDG